MVEQKKHLDFTSAELLKAPLKLNRRSALKILLGLGGAALVGSRFLPRTESQNVSFDSSREFPSLEEILNQFQEQHFSSEEMSNRLLTSEPIVIDPKMLAEIKKQQEVWKQDPTWQARVSALGDSVAGSMALGIFKPEIKNNPNRVRLGPYEPELRDVLSEYQVLTTSIGDVLGVVIGGTTDSLSDPFFCDDGCLPRENLVEALIRIKPVAVFVCGGRNDIDQNGNWDLATFAPKLDAICTQLYRHSIIPVVVNPLVVLEKNGEFYPDVQSLHRAPNWEEMAVKLKEKDLAQFLPISYWYSYYAKAMGFPNICPFPLLDQAYEFGIAGDNLNRHFSYRPLPPGVDEREPDFSEVEIERDFNRNIKDWSGAEVMNLLMLRFLKQYQEIEAA